MYKNIKIADVLRSASARLNVTEIKEGSFLFSLSELIVDESNAAMSIVDNTVKNMHIETADADYTDYYGNDIGLKRIEIPYITILKTDNLAYIETPDGSNFPLFLNGLVILNKGDAVFNGRIKVVAEEDFIIDSSKSKIYVNCTMSATENYLLSRTADFKIGIENNYFKYVVFKVEQDVVFTYAKESDFMYKNRIVREKASNGLRTKNNIRSLLENIEGVHSVSIVNTNDSNIIYFTTDDMFMYGDEATSDLYKRMIQSEVIRLTKWPTTYDVIKRDKATLHFSISINGTPISSIDKIKEAIVSSTVANLRHTNVIDKDKIQSMTKNITGDTITITDMYLIDSVTGSKIHDWNLMEDIYIIALEENISEI
jgi:hypothetical protein